jgi:hypothetical protein
MRTAALLVALMLLLLSVVAFGQSGIHVCVQHLEPTFHYDRMARLARVQGTVRVRLTIESDGRVTSAVGTVVDQQYKAQDILKQRTEELLKKWTFSCIGCAPNSAYEHEMTFTYKLLDGEQEYNETKVVMDLPDRVVVTAYSPVCDHCPPPKKK